MRLHLYSAHLLYMYFVMNSEFCALMPNLSCLRLAIPDGGGGY